MRFRKQRLLTFIELKQLESASGTPALLFGEPIVGVALVFGRFAHTCATILMMRRLLGGNIKAENMKSISLPIENSAGQGPIGLN